MVRRSRPFFILALLCALLAPAAALPAAFGQADIAAARIPPAAAYTADPQQAAPTAVPVARPASQRYTVQAGDTLGAIAERFDLTVAELMRANNITDPDQLGLGQRLIIPSAGQASPAQATGSSERGGVVERLPEIARQVGAASPLAGTLWVTYYGRPNVPILGILGEYGIDELVPRLRRQARAYAEASDSRLAVRPAFHLIYGMATAFPGDDNSHLNYMPEEQVREYIDRAALEGFGVILDVQIGNVTPLTSIEPAFAYLKYNNVQLALDPEFAMTTPGQVQPGNPPGAITSDQINEVQNAMVAYMQQAGLKGEKVLVVHQFLPTMILDKPGIAQVPGIDVVICADGFGAPMPKISKYNGFMSDQFPFAGFKLFYGWDEPLMTERQALGVDPFAGAGYMDVTPSLIVYQ